MRAATQRIVFVAILLLLPASSAHAQLIEVTYRGYIVGLDEHYIGRDIFVSDVVTARVVVDTSAAATESQTHPGSTSTTYPAAALEVSIGQLAYSAANVEVIVWDFDATASDWGVSFPSDLYLVRDADNVVAGPSITSAVDPSKVFAPNSLSVTGRGALNEVSDVLLNLEKFTVLKNIRLSVTFTLPGSDGAPAEIVRAIAVAATVCRIDEHEQGNGKPRRRCTDLAL